MENEASEPEQDQLKDRTMKEFLELILDNKDGILKEFSDKQMIQHLHQMSPPDTVVEVRKTIEDVKAIEQARIGANGEKFYKIIDEEKAITLRDDAVTAVVNSEHSKSRL